MSACWMQFQAAPACLYLAHGAACPPVCQRNKTGNLTIKRFVPAMFVLLSTG